MTLLELLTAALEQLGRATDAQTIELWRDKLTRYLNDAMIDAASAAQPRRTDPVTVSSGTVDTAELPRGCVKVLALTRDGTRVAFYYGVGTGLLHVPGVPDGPACITYRFLPKELRIDTDVPDLPAHAHSLLVTYAVARERAMGDAASLSAARQCFELYREGRRKLRRDMGEADSYRIENRYGEG